MDGWVCVCVNIWSCISVTSFILARSFHSSGYRRIFLHQHLLVLLQHVGQMEQCKHCSLHSVNTNTCESVWKEKQRVNRLQTDIQQKFWKGDEICSLFPNCMCAWFNANATVISWAWRATICCRHHTCSLQKRRRLMQNLRKVLQQASFSSPDYPKVMSAWTICDSEIRWFPIKKKTTTYLNRQRTLRK